MADKSKTAGWSVFILLAVYYFFNRYPGPAFIDSGELALCSLVQGVPHPTGYPLYVILSRCVAEIMPRPIEAVTLLAVILNAFSGYLFFRIAVLIREIYFPQNDRHNIVVAVFTLVLFLSPVVAAQGLTNEVYGLGLVLNLAAIGAVVKLIGDYRQYDSWKYFLAACYLAGLALCNHMSSIQLIPGLVVAAFWMIKRTRRWIMLLPGLAFFILPLTLYAVLPIRAAAQPPPVANWGDVAAWDNFVRHVSGWQFRVWAFTGNPYEIGRNIGVLGRLILDQFPVLFLPLTLAGVVFLWRHAKKILFFMGVVMLVNILLGINYSIPDIDSYYLQTFAFIILLALIGIYYLARYLKSKYLLYPLAAGLLIWQAVAVWNENDKSDFTLPEDYALNMGRSAEPGAIILSEIWDHYGQLFYLQQAEGFRTDLTLIDKELLRRSWYYKVIERVYPDAYAEISDLAPPFLREVKIFESGGDYDPNALEYYFQSIINRLLTRCGPAYIDYRLDYTPAGDHYLRPCGLLYKLDTLAIETPLPQPDLIWRGKDLDEYTGWRARKHVEMIETMRNYWRTP